MEKAMRPPATEEAAGPSGARAHTLPSSTVSEAPPTKKDKEKKFGRFAKKK